MAINRELSQFASFVEVDNTSKNIGIAVTATPYVGIGTTNPIAKLDVVGKVELDDVNISGVTTAARIGVTGLTTSLNLSISGIASVGTAITMYGATGIISAYKFYGDGSGLTGTISGIGIRSEGADIGYGATIIDFKGPGVSTITNISAGIVTVFFEGGGGGSTIDKETFNVGVGGTSLVTLTSPYTAGNIDVFLNGLKLVPTTDYTETSANVITLTIPAVNGDVIETVSFATVGALNDIGLAVQQDNVAIASSISTFNFVGGANTYYNRGNNILDIYPKVTQIYKQSFTVGVAGTNLLTLTVPYTAGNIDVYRNGIRLASGDFTELSSTTVGLATTAVSGDIVEIQSYETLVNSSLGVGIQSSSLSIGSSITTLNFIGAGNTFLNRGNGVVDISIQGGGGGISTTGIATAAIFSNFQFIYENQDLTAPNHNYGVFGPIGIVSTITVGVGNTFVVV